VNLAGVKFMDRNNHPAGRYATLTVIMVFNPAIAHGMTNLTLRSEQADF
jgi:hypothetical protein